MKVMLVTCCQSVSMDQRRNSASIFNIYEEWNTPSFPFVMPGFTVFVLFERTQDEDPGEVSLRMTIDEQELLLAQLNLNFQGRLRLRSINEIGGLVIPRPGVFKLSIQKQGQELGGWEIPVNHIGQATAEPQII